MSLITKEVEIKLCGTNIKWFEEKGYKIPRRADKRGRLTVPKNTKIKISVNDLQPRSNVEVDVDCDCCRKIYSIHWSDYQIQLHDGKIYCKSCANKVLHSGKNHPNWNPNLTDEDRKNGRDYPEYVEFIKKVQIRDKYTCQYCGKKHRDLEVHHLNGYNWFIEGRVDETNASLLCSTCHSNFHSIYGRGYNTKEQYEEWIGKKNSIIKTYNGEVPSTRWAYCITDNEVIKNIVKYAKDNNIDYSPIYRCCDGNYPIYRNKIYMWYDEYIELTDKEIKKHIKKREENAMIIKKVVCINYKLLFNSTKYGGLYLGINKSSIIQCCNNNRKSAGKSQTGEKLIWKYVSDIDNLDNYTLISDEECKNKALLRNQESS